MFQTFTHSRMSLTSWPTETLVYHGYRTSLSITMVTYHWQDNLHIYTWDWWSIMGLPGSTSNRKLFTVVDKQLSIFPQDWQTHFVLRKTAIELTDANEVLGFLSWLYKTCKKWDGKWNAIQLQNNSAFYFPCPFCYLRQTWNVNKISY